jgi:CheY-like chemotaxis protein
MLHVPHFLIVEDDQDDLFFLKRALKKLRTDHTLEFCESVSEAKAYITGEGKFSDRETYPLPSVLLTDLRLGQESGLDLLEWCRKRPELRTTPLILLTGSASPKDLSEARNRGASQTILKPLDAQALAQAVKQLAASLPGS